MGAGGYGRDIEEDWVEGEERREKRRDEKKLK